MQRYSELAFERERTCTRRRSRVGGAAYGPQLSKLSRHVVNLGETLITLVRRGSGSIGLGVSICRVEEPVCQEIADRPAKAISRSARLADASQTCMKAAGHLPPWVSVQLPACKLLRCPQGDFCLIRSSVQCSRSWPAPALIDCCSIKPSERCRPAHGLPMRQTQPSHQRRRWRTC